MRANVKLLLQALVGVITLTTATAYAGTLHVNCDATKGLTRISKAIALLQKSGSPGPNTIVVSGSCKENIVIQSMDNLTLSAETGASISDRSHGNADIIDIQDSRRIAIIGFTINGGADGVGCFGFSLCRLFDNTIQGSSGFGVWAINSQVALNNDVVQNHASRGVAIVNGSQVNADGSTIQGNGEGIVSNIRGTLGLSNSSVQGNGNRGIFAETGSSIRMLASTVTANGSDGVQLQKNSQLSIENFSGASSITGNGGAGVSVGDLSFAFFDAGSNVTGNTAGADVICLPQFSATRGATTNLGGGTTNCVEP